MLAHTQYRADIDGLRAIAVLAVIIFHAFPKLLPGGFIGVDVFFVISGFLISSILYRELEQKRFSFWQFYARRIRRIFPALLVALAATLAAGYALLLPDELKTLGSHIAASAGFVQNFMLWNEVGYFDKAADHKPLLHLWSLGIEEQFYIFFPLILWGAWRLRKHLHWVLAGLLLLSFAANLHTMQTSAGSAFYLPHTRVWELLAGALLALYAHKQAYYNNALSLAGLGLLGLGLFFISQNVAFPGWWALLPVSGAVMLISAQPQAIGNRLVLSNRLMVAIGLISYPLYLWHWVLFSFSRISLGDEPNIIQKLLLITASFALATATYWFIEKPLRFGKHGNFKAIVLAGFMLLAGLVGLLIYKSDGLPQRAIALRHNGFLEMQKHNADLANIYGNSWQPCSTVAELQGMTTRTAQGCSTSGTTSGTGEPTYVIFGDSHAGPIAYPLLAHIRERNGRLVIMNYPGCAPLLGTKRTTPQDSAIYCGEFGLAEEVLHAMAALKPSHVIIAARWSMYTKDNALTDADDATLRGTELLEKRLPQTLEALKAIAPVIVIESTPILEAEPAAGLLRNSRAFEPTLEAHHERNEFTHNFFSAYRGIDLIDPATALCPNSKCRAVIDGQLLYNDADHLSAQGALRLLPLLNPYISIP